MLNPIQILLVSLLLGLALLLPTLSRIFSSKPTGLYSDTNFVIPAGYDRVKKQAYGHYSIANNRVAIDHLNTYCNKEIETEFRDHSYVFSCEIQEGDYRQKCFSSDPREAFCSAPEPIAKTMPQKCQVDFIKERFPSYQAHRDNSKSQFTNCVQKNPPPKNQPESPSGNKFRLVPY